MLSSVYLFIISFTFRNLLHIVTGALAQINSHLLLISIFYFLKRVRNILINDVLEYYPGNNNIR